MKKWIYILCIIVIVVVAVIVGTMLYKNDNTTNNNEVQENLVNNVVVKENSYSVKNDITIQTTVEEEKISPNATIILKRHYLECNHIIREYMEVPEELVNLTKEELEQKKPEWTIEKFSTSEIILIKDESGICNEHYVLRESEGLIAVYKVEGETETLEELTGISTEYLTLEDREKIKAGIKVYGIEELNSVLEDYE